MILLHNAEIHANAIAAGRGQWRSVPKETRRELLASLCQDILETKAVTKRRLALFAVVREPGAVPHADPIERTFEEIYLRFNSFLSRRELPEGAERGLVVADEAKYEKSLQPMVNEWREAGTRVGRRLRQIVEIPLFVDSRATRMLQLADLVAYAAWRCYQRADDHLIDRLFPAFDWSDDVLHGLVHLVQDHRTCLCPPCASRRKARETGGEPGPSEHADGENRASGI